MKVTQIRENEKSEALSLLDLERLIERIKTEIKTQPVAEFRQALQYLLRGERSQLVEKLPKIMPAAIFARVDGVKKMKSYNGIVELSVGPLAGRMEVEVVKRKAAELPQTLLAFMGSSGKSVKIWIRFSRPDGTLPQNREEAACFHAHAYRLAFKCYQPQLPFEIQLKEPGLEQYSRLSHDTQPYYHPDSIAFYLSQPNGMPDETIVRKIMTENQSPLERAVPGYESREAIGFLYEASLRKAYQEMEEGWNSDDDLHPLISSLANYCFLSGIPEEEATRRSVLRFGRTRKVDMFFRETIGNVYRKPKGFGSKNSLTKEQYLTLQTDEFMNRRYDFRFNTQTGEVEYRDRCSFFFYFRSADKRVQNSIMLDAQSEGIPLWDKDVARYLNSNRITVYNPLEEFLFGLHGWDGKDRIAELAARVPCDNPHWEMLFHRWFLNMVAHWSGFDKKHANSTSPLLVGAQGTRKSTFCRELMPPELRAYYTDSIDFGRKRDAELYLNRFALINIDEFDQVTLTQQGFLKHIFQKPEINIRKPHGSSIQPMRRYASFIGTSNQKDLLTDPSGSRRFICVEVTGCIDTNRPIDYDQLYAQAMAELYRGDCYWFDADAERIMVENNQEFEQTPPIMQLFHQYFRAATGTEEGEELSPMELLDCLQKKTKMPLSTGKAHHFGRLLQKAGVPSRHTYKGTLYRVVAL